MIFYMINELFFFFYLRTHTQKKLKFVVISSFPPNHIIKCKKIAQETTKSYNFWRILATKNCLIHFRGFNHHKLFNALQKITCISILVTSNYYLTVLSLKTIKNMFYFYMDQLNTKCFYKDQINTFQNCRALQIYSLPTNLSA